jgi:hypothetical protein
VALQRSRRSLIERRLLRLWLTLVRFAGQAGDGRLQTAIAIAQKSTGQGMSCLRAGRPSAWAATLAGVIAFGVGCAEERWRATAQSEIAGGRSWS